MTRRSLAVLAALLLAALSPRAGAEQAPAEPPEREEDPGAEAAGEPEPAAELDEPVRASAPEAPVPEAGAEPEAASGGRYDEQVPAGAGAGAEEPPGEATDQGREEPPGTARLGPLLVRPLAEVRLRGELRTDPYAASGSGPDSYLVGSRARLGLEAGYEWLRAVVLLQDARRFGEAPAGVDAGETTGLHLGYLELRADWGWLRLGRQEVGYGAERLVGPLNWSTAARAFDAVRLHATRGRLELDAVAAMVRMPRTVAFELPSGETGSVESEGDYLAGVLASWAPLDAIALDLYVLFRHDGPTEPAAGADPLPAVERERDVVAPGLRLHGSPAPGLAYDLEAVLQAGRAAGERHLAFGLAAEVSYALQVPGRPGLALGGAYASGGSPGDALTELDNFYPTNHPFYGAADLFGWRNLVEGHARLSAAPDRVALRPVVSFLAFALADPSSRWSDAGGRTLGLEPDNDERLLGYELDLELGYLPAAWLRLSAGYSVFFPARAAEALGHGRPTHFAYLMVGAVLP